MRTPRGVLVLVVVAIATISSSTAQELLDTLGQGFQTIGARCRVVPTNVTPGGAYEVPVRYNFGNSIPDRWVKLSLLMPGGSPLFTQEFYASAPFGDQEVLVQVPPYAPIGSSLAWDVEMRNASGTIFDETTLDITIIQPPTNFGYLLAGDIGVNPYWDGLYDNGIQTTPDEVEDCENEIFDNLLDRFFDWAFGGSGDWSDGATTINPGSIGTEPEKISAGVLRAYKLYKGLETGNNQFGQAIIGGVGAKETMAITNGSGLDIFEIFDWGYNVEGTHKIMMHPPGWGNDGGDGRVFALGDYALDPQLAELGYQEMTVDSQRFAVVSPSSAYELDYGSWYASGDDDYADDDEGGAEERVDIDFSVEFNQNNNTITISHGVGGTASWPLWGICAVNVEGSSSGQATYSADGDLIEAEFVLAHGGTSFECGPLHPCWHGEVEMDMGIIMRITYPTACKVRFEFSLVVAAGAHGEFWAGHASQSRELSASWKKELGAWDYSICNDADVQTFMQTYFSDLLDEFGLEVAIGQVLANY